MAANLSEMRGAGARTAEAEQMSEFQRLLQQPSVRPSFEDLPGFALLQRMAKLWANSPMVPKSYRENVASCAIALNIAVRMRADPLMVMQNLVEVHGRPTWSAKYLIATVNSARDDNGKRLFSPLRYEFFGTQGTDGWGCRAYAIEQATGERLVGTSVTIGIAKSEGWYERSGSKWKTMPEQMLRYRAAAWWTNVYAPDLSMGLSSVEEIEDAGELAPARNEMLEAMRAVERETQASVAAMAAAAPPAGMDPATGEIPPPAAQAQQTPPAQQPATAPAPAQQQPVTQAQPADEDDGLDDWRCALADCDTAADCDDVLKSYRGKPGSDEAKALRALCDQQKKKIAADGFGGGE